MKTYGAALVLLAISSGFPPAYAASPYIKGIKVLASGNSRVDWSWARDQIVYDQLGPGSYYNIYVMNPDGTGSRCMTCSVSALPGKHIGNPEVDPTGNWVVFQAERADVTGVVADYFANPGSGIDNDIWIMDWNAQHFLKVTNVALQQGGVLHPHFSHRGDKICWAERYSASGSPYGLWMLKVADFSVQNGAPVVSNIQTFTPGAQKQFYETHGFSGDDSTLIFSGNLDPGLSVYDIDIYTLNLQTGALTNLTNSPGEWDEHAHYNPVSSQIWWMSSKGLATPDTSGQVQTDYWIMNLDGSQKERMTYFNDPLAPEFIQNVTHVTAADCAWNKDGTKMVAGLITGQATGAGELVVFDFSWFAIHVSAASFQSVLAPSAISASFGRGLAFGIAPAPSPNFPPSLGGTTVSVTDSAGVTRQAQLYFVSPGQVNYVVPDGTAPGPATITISINGQIVSASPAQVSKVAPAFFTANQNGQGAPAAIFTKVGAGGSQTNQFAFQCSSTCSTLPMDVSSGQVYLSLYGTGIRNASSLGGVTATIAGRNLPVQYAGAQSQYAGFDQVVIQIPPSLAGTGETDLTVNVDGSAANTVRVNFK